MPDYERCKACGVNLARRGDEPDPCLGYLPGVSFACCGHGVSEGYVLFNDGTRVGGIFNSVDMHYGGRRGGKRSRIVWAWAGIGRFRNRDGSLRWDMIRDDLKHIGRERLAKWGKVRRR